MRHRLALLVLFLLPHAQAAVPTTRPTSAPAAQVNFLGMGDWGQLNSNQPLVAKAMSTYITTNKIPLNAILLAGDNFYGKLTGTDDPMWQTIFEKMYDPATLAVPFYVTLGNHDYRDGKAAIELAYAQEHPDSRWKLPTKWYREDFPANHPNANTDQIDHADVRPDHPDRGADHPDLPLVSVLMLDSNRDNLVKTGEWATELAWLEAELEKLSKTDRWIICCAHHTLISNGLHGDNGVLQKEWGTLFKKYHVALYLCGHDHDIQHLELPDWPISFVLAGGGGKASRAMLRDIRGPFSKAMNGFAHLQFTEEKITVSLIGIEAKPVHVFERGRDGTVNILFTTPSDKATTHPLKAKLENDLADLKSTTTATTTSTTRPASKP